MSKSHILNACDTISEAAAFVRALEMTTRDPSGNYADPGDANAVAAVCFAAQDKLSVPRYTVHFHKAEGELMGELEGVKIVIPHLIKGLRDTGGGGNGPDIQPSFVDAARFARNF